MIASLTAKSFYGYAVYFSPIILRGDDEFDLIASHVQCEKLWVSALEIVDCRNESIWDAYLARGIIYLVIEKVRTSIELK